MKYIVNNTSLQYETVGARQFGHDVVLLKDAIDLTTKTTWCDKGYTIEELFDKSLYTNFSRATYQLLIKLWQMAGLHVPEDFQLDQYHNLITTKEEHLAVIDHTKLLDVDNFPIEISLLEERISEICHEKLKVKNPYDKKSYFHFRIIRPNQQDNNPLHRDVWLDDFKDCINLYIPITGSNENSTLIIIPGSQQWPESRVERTISGAKINGVKYNVPAVTSISGDVEYVRANPAINQVLIFSPYLIHGGASNLNINSTRISIEIRLWKK